MRALIYLAHQGRVIGRLMRGELDEDMSTQASTCAMQETSHTDINSAWADCFRGCNGFSRRTLPAYICMGRWRQVTLILRAVTFSMLHISD